MLKLTNRQTDILNFIKQCISEFGYPPTRAEIAQKLGFKSSNAAEEHLKALARKGAIQIIPGTSRGIKIPNDTATEDNLPIIGQVAAGEPILAQQHIDEICDVSPNFFHPKADYLLKVKGMSMKDIGILDGDLLAVHSTQQANNGQIVVARIDNDVTVKRFKREKNIVWLLAENTDFSPIRVDLETDEFTIEGLSVGIIRR